MTNYRSIPETALEYVKGSTSEADTKARSYAVRRFIGVSLPRKLQLLDGTTVTAVSPYFTNGGFRGIECRVQFGLNDRRTISAGLIAGYEA